MINRATRLSVGVAVFASGMIAFLASAQTQHALDVFPTEARTETDPDSGASLTYITSNEAKDTNLYFHERSWSADGSFVLFYSTRENGGLMGYIVSTGELFRVSSPSGAVGAATASLKGNSVFAVRGNDVLEIGIKITPAKNPKRKRSQVSATERVICTLPSATGSTALNENCDGTKLAIGRVGTPDGGDPVILIIDQETGGLREVCRVSAPQQFMHHVQWSQTSVNLLSFAGIFPRINVVNTDTGEIMSPYNQLRDELVTHEHWWANDQIVFCGGTHPQPAEDSHVKVVDVKTGVTRILAAGSWWPAGSDEDVAKQNYWHCSGSPDGRWVAADNWHGDISVIEGKNARPIVLTAGHRTYGSGDHPHVGWDRKGEQVIFTSHKLGSADVCIATIPRAMQDANNTSPVSP
ncbi:MAG TPA: hypothetical protein PLJ47_02265 [Candidatus Hydrogenedentes bacterium]|nr:hypothetical protein [Candidatus Hydrogenedentota bacterium]HRK33392.1 hypothetical protein [Candidatus Hydrogenedentota bacterium]